MQGQPVENHELCCNLPDDSQISIIGLGGVGSIVLRYLAIFLRSLMIPVRLRLIDGDWYVPANEDRQVFTRLGNKAEIQSAEILALLEPSEISVIAVPEFIRPDSIERIVPDGEIIFACVDSHGVRRLLSDHCESPKIQNVVLFSGGNDAVNPPQERGTYGNVQIYVKRRGRHVTVPITRFHPEIAGARFDSAIGNQGCGQLMAKGNPQILFANLAVASALLNAFFAYCCNALGYQEVKFDILDARMMPQLAIPQSEDVSDVC